MKLWTHLQHAGRFIFIAVILVLMRSAQAQGGVIQYGQTINSSTATTGTENWTFAGAQGDVVIISMESAEFDTYLELRGPDGVLLTSDDDGGADRNSQIVRSLPTTGQYTITTGGFQSARGAYTLSLSLSPEFAASVQNALAGAGIAAGSGYIADGMSEDIIDLTDEDLTVRWNSLDGVYTDFVMGADIRWGPGAAEDTCGFLFRRVDDDNYYVVEIDRGGNVWFTELADGEWGDAQGDTYLAVRTGAKDTNRLVLVVTGITFTVYVNGQRTATFSDNSNPSGTVAVEMSTYDESMVTNCTFDNVWVWDMPATAPLATPTISQLPTLPPLPTPSGPVALPTKTPVGGVGTSGSAPIILNVTSQGPCSNVTLTVNWRDADGDAQRIEWLDADTGAVEYTDAISGSGGSFPSSNWVCDSGNCVTNLRIVDAAGHMSSTYEAVTTCS